ncbi:hypothetical protein L2E82_27358 [Cichorium intybus]|uniref:Uncharacterized protein n=1 Tax=Cichorium intybus TaxID=13427 RepID=A0ACB9CST6_CICIN|nr:hypothetical protein L2E82_27358 [Cichorium intybus]
MSVAIGTIAGTSGGERGKRNVVVEGPPVVKATQQKQRRMINTRESGATSREGKQFNIIFAYLRELVADCCQYHQAKDGDGWVEYKGSLSFDGPHKVEIPHAFVCDENGFSWGVCWSYETKDE